MGGNYSSHLERSADNPAFTASLSWDLLGKKMRMKGITGKKNGGKRALNLMKMGVKPVTCSFVASGPSEEPPL